MKSDERTSLLSEKNNVTYDAVSDEENNETNNEERQIFESEGRSAWLVVAASFLCICVLDGTMYSFGCFLNPLMAEMKQSRSTIFIAGSLQVALSAFIAPVAAWLVVEKGSTAGLLGWSSNGLIWSSTGKLCIQFFGNLWWS